MMLMAENERWDFILHPLCLAIIMRKWNLFGHVMYYGQLLFYITFLTLLNVHILTSVSPIQIPYHPHCSAFSNQTSLLYDQSK